MQESFMFVYLTFVTMVDTLRKTTKQLLVVKNFF